MNYNVSFSLQTSRTALEEALHFGHAQCTKLLMRASSIAKQNVSVKCGSLVHAYMGREMQLPHTIIIARNISLIYIIAKLGKDYQIKRLTMLV